MRPPVQGSSPGLAGRHLIHKEFHALSLCTMIAATLFPDHQNHHPDMRHEIIPQLPLRATFCVERRGHDAPRTLALGTTICR